MSSSKQLFSSVCMFILIVTYVEPIYAQDSAFVKLNFDAGISIEVPRNWTYLDKNIRKHIDTGGEATVRMAGIAPNNGQNNILVAANTYTSHRTTSGLLRLSVRNGSSPTQDDMHKLSELPESQVAQILSPVADSTRKAMLGVEGFKSVKAVNSKVIVKNGLVCMFFEYETDFSDGIKLSQTYLCPLGDRSVKLSTSYRKSESRLFRPVVEYVWTTLQVK